VDRQPHCALDVIGSRGGGDPYLPGHGDESYEVESYEIELDYRVASNHLDARAELVVHALAPLQALSLDLAGFAVSKVLVNGLRPRKFANRGRKLVVQLAEPVPPGARLTLSIRYAGQPRPQRSTWGEVGWEELSDGVIVAGQPSGAPSWFPCNDRPGNKATYRLSITAESSYVVIANGLLVDRRMGASRTTWVYAQEQPMATYLATVQIGRYEIDELAVSPVPQHLVVPQRLRRDARSDFARQAEMVEVFSELFGPYPFDAYTVVVTDDELEIPLEAQGVSVFGANHVDGERGAERLVAHELAHQWFGNSLTLGHWVDIWLHEGFACYAEWLWSERSGGASADENARRQHKRLASLAQDLLVAEPGADNMFDDRLYKRGALTLHALRLKVGDEAFFALLREWVAEHRFGTVTTAEFEDHANRYGQVTTLLRTWLYETALPALPATVQNRT
jgi:aminopeptidase N